MRLFDSHQHFWTIGGPGQTWPDADWPLLFRDFGPEQLRQEAAGLHLTGSVLVQSQPDDRDTEWMHETVGNDPLVEGIVGWVDLAAPDAVAKIGRLAQRPKTVGIRPMLQAIEDSRWILDPDLKPAIMAMLDHGLRFDALVEPRHLVVLDVFAQNWPELPIVINHVGKPDIAKDCSDWRQAMAALAERANVWCKISGLRIQSPGGASREQLRPVLGHVLDRFAERAMWGSDWPVQHHVGDSYADWVNIVDEFAASLPQTGRDRLFEGAGRAFYGLPA